MIKTRIIPVILWDGINCVQTTKFGRPARNFGSLMDIVRVYENRQVDELILLDINNDGPPRFDTIDEFTGQVFAPLTVGGGVRNLQDIDSLLRNGADKVAIRRHATSEFISTASKKFGAQSIVVALDITPKTRFLAVPRAIECEQSGAGELLLTSTEHNGMMEGYDLDLISKVSRALNIPVIAHGGCGKPEHMLSAIDSGAHAVAASTMFLFTETTPRDCAEYLHQQGKKVRLR